MTQRSHTAPPSSAASTSPSRLALASPVGTVLSHKCLVPVETPLSQDGELSARHAQHRSSDRFEAVVHDTTWLLDHALGGLARHGGLGLSRLSGDRETEDRVGSSAAAAAHGSDNTTSHTRGPATATTSGSSDLYANAKTRRVVTAQAQRAFAFFRLHQFSRAVRDYDACLAREPTAAVLYYNRGCAFYAWGKKDRAVHDFTRALKLDCKNALFVESRAAVRKELGRFHEAIQDYTWLETLRRLAHHDHPRNHDSVAHETVRDSSGRDAVLATVRGSFSMTFSELQASLLGASLLKHSDVLPAETVTTEALTAEERERHVLEWMVRFLQRSPRTRSRTDLREAVEFARHWSFFRAMDAPMVEQCLEDAAYAFHASDAVVVQQGDAVVQFRVVLNATAPFVKNVDALSGVSKLRELHKLSQGDAVGSDACAASGGDGTLRTIRCDATATGNGNGNGNGRPAVATAPLERHNSLHLPTVPMLSVPSSEVGALLPPEPASFTSLEPVHCLLLAVDAYREILHDHEEQVLDDRAAFLRGCRVFQSCSDDVLAALAAVSGARVYDPGTNLLTTGDEVTQLCVIRRGVCQVRKTLRVPAHEPQAATVKRKTSKTTKLSPLSEREDNDDTDDGSWVLDNGWMLTNPRLVNTPLPPMDGGVTPHQAVALVAQDVGVGILASGQVFGELSVLQPGQPSQVTIHSQTLVEVLVITQRDLATLHIQYHSGTMNALQESLLFHNPPQQKIVQLQRDRATWDKHKRSVLRELALQLPTKAQSVLRGAACMTPVSTQSPMRRRASLVSVPPLATRHKREGHKR